MAAKIKILCNKLDYLINFCIINNSLKRKYKCYFIFIIFNTKN